MLKVHVAERLAVAAELVSPARPTRRSLSLGIVAAVLAGVVCLMMLYVGVRELTQPGWIDGRGVAPEIASRLKPADGPAKLMSIDDMRRLADEN